MARGMSCSNNLPIHEAAAAGIVSDVISLCTNKDFVNVANNIGWTPIMLGAYYGHVDVVKALLSFGADITLKNRFGGDIYALSAASGSVGILRILCCHHRMNDEQLSNSLTVAVTFGHVPVVRFLIDSGANPSSSTANSGTVPLMIAVVENKYEIVKLLVHRGADITCKNYAGYSALELARIKENKLILSFLQEQLGNDCDCEPAYATVKNKEAVAQAARSGDLNKLKSLLCRNPSLSTSQHWMVHLHDEGETGLEDDDVFIFSEDLNCYLKQKQSNAPCHQTYPNIGDRNDENHKGDLLNLFYSPCTSSFHCSLLAGRKNIQNKICHSDSEIVDREVTTPVKHMTGSKLYPSGLSKMTLNSSKKIVNHFKQYKTSKNIGTASKLSISEVTTGDGEGIVASPLILACFNGHVKAARLLIAAGADPNRQRNGRTPLMLAAIASNMELAELLLSAGADPFVESHVDSLTAFELASLSGADTEVIRQIASHTFPCDDFCPTRLLQSLDLPLKSDDWSLPRRMLTKVKSVISPRLHSNMFGPSDLHPSDSLKSKEWISPLKKVKKTQHKAARKLFSSPVICSSLGKESSEKMKNLPRWSLAFPNTLKSSYSLTSNSALQTRPFDTPFVSYTSDKISEIMPPPFIENRHFNIIEEVMHKTGKSARVKDQNSVSICPELFACKSDAPSMNVGVLPCTPLDVHLEERMQINISSTGNSNDATFHEGKFEDFIEKCDLHKYASLFRENEVTDIEVLLSVDEDDLQEMGIMNPEERKDVLG
ncbi:serine/threonine-protein phosphatase 6 regulatory ankyrin repeat subunit C-like isoform X2 [Ischnura elegans]|nr:serine/threonine-protein phosphatase 6 regulatory ankyrin repeat subunit C-like isoform X2 [Ischnura elegans]